MILAKGSCVISEMEIIDEPVCMGGARQALLQILQRKGAPVRGVIIHEIIDGYDWTAERDPLKRNYHYSWIKAINDYR